MLAKQEEGEIRAGCRGNMRACWKVDVNGRSKHNESEPRSGHAHTSLRTWSLCRVFTLMLWCVCKYINKSASPSCAFTPVWSICSTNNLLLSKWVNCKCIKCTISTDVSSRTHNHVVMNAVTGKCSPLYQLALVLHYLILIVLLAKLSCKAHRLFYKLQFKQPF